jgi:hypothetical protein
MLVVITGVAAAARAAASVSFLMSPPGCPCLSFLMSMPGCLRLSSLSSQSFPCPIQCGCGCLVDFPWPPCLQRVRAGTNPTRSLSHTGRIILVSISQFSYAVSFSVVGIGFYPAAAALVAPPTSGRMAFSCSVVYVPDTHMCIYMLYLPFANQSYAISGSYASV